MKAILQYLQKAIASGKDGTICILIDTGEVASLTIKDRSIVAATLEDSTGKQALEAIKLAVIIHMEFWNGITRRSDVHKMIVTQAETNALAPIPADELSPEGVPIPVDTDDRELENEEEEDITETTPPKPAPEENTLTDRNLQALTDIMTDFIGPAAGIVVEGIAEKTQNMNEMVRLLSDELFDENDRSEFYNKAYFLISHL